MSDKQPSKIGVIGAGVMGNAILQGLIESKLYKPSELWVMDKSEAACEDARRRHKIEAVTFLKKLLPGTQCLILCVKPKQAKEVIESLKGNGLPADTLVISILAGVTTTKIEELLSTKNPVVRAMPNTPCIVGEGITVVCGGKNAKPDHVRTAARFFGAVGKCIELDEQYFDAVTGLSASGPAYLYLIMEALADGGVRVGLPRKEAMQIITQTVLGAAKMVQKTGRHPAALRDDVTTPAGCTIGALLIMEDGKIRSVLARAVEEATRIASGLG